MCVFDKGNRCSALTEKFCKNSSSCSFRQTKEELDKNQKRADVLFTQNTGYDVKDRMLYVESHATV